MTPQLNRALDDLRIEFAAEFANGDIRHVGITNCRRKNNKPDGPYSEHAWSNAGDIMLRNWPGRKALGDRIAAYMRSKPALWSEVFWQIAAHYDHVHGTATPRRNYDNQQIPPCAGGKDDDMDPAEIRKIVREELDRRQDGDPGPANQFKGITHGVWSAFPGGAKEPSAWQLQIRMRDTINLIRAGVETLLKRTK